MHVILNIEEPILNFIVTPSNDVISWDSQQILPSTRRIRVRTVALKAGAVADVELVAVKDCEVTLKDVPYKLKQYQTIKTVLDFNLFQVNGIDIYVVRQ